MHKEILNKANELSIKIDREKLSLEVLKKMISSKIKSSRFESGFDFIIINQQQTKTVLNFLEKNIQEEISQLEAKLKAL